MIDRLEIELERERLFAGVIVSESVPSSFGAADYLNAYRQGYFMMEDVAGLIKLVAQKREHIPLREEFPHGAIKDARRHQYQFSTNQQFETVLDNGTSLRVGTQTCQGEAYTEQDCWILDRSKNILRELHRSGHAHSVEVLQEGKLVGGAIGIQVGATFAALSIFSDVSGAGNTAMIGLGLLLSRQGFDIFDSLMPSTLSRFYGGSAVLLQYDLTWRRKAVRANVVFPTLLPQTLGEHFPDYDGLALDPMLRAPVTPAEKPAQGKLLELVAK